MLHLVNAKFGSAAKTILYRTQYAVHIMLVALKLNDGVDDML